MGGASSKDKRPLCKRLGANTSPSPLSLVLAQLPTLLHRHIPAELIAIVGQYSQSCQMLVVFGGYGPKDNGDGNDGKWSPRLKALRQVWCMTPFTQWQPGASITVNQWAEATPMPMAGESPNAAVIGDTIMVIG
jgi:hypothetical protein